MDKQSVLNYVAGIQSDKHKLENLLIDLSDAKPHQEYQVFDSILANKTGDRETAIDLMPEPMVKLLTDESIVAGNSQQCVFDGIRLGVEEFKKRNGGEAPPSEVILSALYQATMFTDKAPAGATGDKLFDSLSFEHHEALSVVPAAVQVVLAMGIANAIPIVSMLPNPTGSNEVPIVYGDAVASSWMGVMKPGDLIDGDKAGMPYLENRHTIVMEQDSTDTAKFSLTVRVAYDKVVRDDLTTKFVSNKASMPAPFLGGRVVVTVKGVEVANDKNRDHPTKGGVSVLQPVGKVTIGADTFLVKRGTASLDNHTVEVEFDTTEGVAPEADDVEVDIIFDYERKYQNGHQILREPGTDVEFAHSSVFAYPSRALNHATIDAITQLANELNINWYGAALSIVQQKYYFEQTARLLRQAVNRALRGGENRRIVFNAQKQGLSPNTMADMFSNLKITLGIGRTELSKSLNFGVGSYDLYVGDNGAAMLSGLPESMFTPTGQTFGDQYNIYRIGTLNDGANVYYVPSSMGVFNETREGNAGTALALMCPRPLSPAKAPFVGHIAVPPTVLAHKPNAFDDSVGVYSRQAADINPVKRYSNQFMIIEMINLPTL
ncbi:MAG: hypothetical protein Q4P13_12770 [Psychrobacter sp.]|nr:hypothetical protein [Psychrobacter sp.]